MEQGLVFGRQRRSHAHDNGRQNGFEAGFDFACHGESFPQFGFKRDNGGNGRKVERDENSRDFDFCHSVVSSPLLAAPNGAAHLCRAEQSTLL
jgi:hypothetical protein